MNTIELAKKYLIDYLKNKDVLFKKIKDIKEESDSFTIIFNERKTKYLIQLDIIPKKLIEELENNRDLSLVCVNNSENLKKVIKLWKTLISYRNFSIYFINPFSETGKHWALFPATHYIVTDRFKHGLSTLQSSVEKISLEEFEKKANEYS
ncbi:hypothetical protein DRJ17_02035 [Candidatus Woesearchaeota archaeon]|nr:MAG: hypothetical protein DRJ17_02035 [Candidatus Woesearchaeota archaeon]